MPSCPVLCTALREQDGVGARAFEFLVLTAARTGEVIGARWSEIDLQSKVWTVPAARMKAGKAHRVPLCPRAVAILHAIRPDKVRQDTLVFPGSKPAKTSVEYGFFDVVAADEAWPSDGTRVSGNFQDVGY